MRKSIWILALIVTVGLTLVGLAGIAVACDAGTHCYGEATWNPAASNRGARGTVFVTCIQANNTNNFVTAEIWLGKNSWWVEEGIAHGYPRTDRYWFWADFRPVWGYFEHPRPDLASNLSTNYLVSLIWDSGNEWQVRREGTQIGTSTDNFSEPADRMDAGSELIANGDRVDAKVKDFEWKSTGNVWQSDWENGSNHAVLFESGPYNATWTTQYKSVRARANQSDC